MRHRKIAKIEWYRDDPTTRCRTPLCRKSAGRIGLYASGAAEYGATPRHRRQLSFWQIRRATMWPAVRLSSEPRWRTFHRRVTAGAQCEGRLELVPMTHDRVAAQQLELVRRSRHRRPLDVLLRAQPFHLASESPARGVHQCGSVPGQLASAR